MHADNTAAVVTTTADPVAIVRDAASGNERAKFRTALKNWSEMLATLEIARRAVSAFVGSADDLNSDEVRRHGIEDVREDAVHLLYAIGRDISLMECTLPSKLNDAVAKATERLWQASRVS